MENDGDASTMSSTVTNINAPIFRPLKFPSGLEVKNRIFRSNISGRFDNYDGSGGYARINWEEKFARGGVGGIISSYTPVHVRGTDHGSLRHDRQRRQDQVLERRSASGSTSTAASSSCSSATRAASKTRGVSRTNTSTRRARRALPTRSMASSARRWTTRRSRTSSSTSPTGALRAQEGRPRRRRAAWSQRLPDHPVPQLGDQQPQGRIRRTASQPIPIRPRDHPGDPGEGRAELPPPDEDQRRRPRQRALSLGEERATRSTNRSRSASGSRRMAPMRSSSRPATRSRIRPTLRAAGPSNRRHVGTTRCSRRGFTPGGSTSC